MTSAIKIVLQARRPEDPERKLAECDRPNKLIVTEGVFSLEGTIRPPAFVALARSTTPSLMIDDAHGVGFSEAGRRRRGLLRLR
jgi:7-keto-8-aminopelargonate synthetase-like enzyme